MPTLTRKIFIYFLIALISLPMAAFAIEAQDIIVVYNRSMPGSKDVAEHYVEKRNVPKENMLGIFLSRSESISRIKYESDLLPPLREKLKHFKKVGKNPAVLLVYGVPLKVDNVLTNGEKEWEKLVNHKIEELSALVTKLSNNLLLLSNSKEQVPQTSTDVPAIISLARKAILSSQNFQKQAKQLPNPPEIPPEHNSIIFRLVGLSPVINSFVKGAKHDGADIQSVIKNSDLIKLNLSLTAQLIHISFRGVTNENIQDVASLMRTSQGLMGELKFWYEQKDKNLSTQSSASVDSEIALILTEPYLRAKWLPNPFLNTYDKLPGIKRIRENTIKVARLDGPAPEIAKRLVDDAVIVEKNGLKGIFYIDARGLEEKRNAYFLYDEHLRKLYKILTEKSTMNVVLDDNSKTFQEDCCPDAALYCGWYSLGKYVDSFRWKKGAVGFHIASSEASTLRDPDSQVWCKRMLEKGVAATLGPVREPYLTSFPAPDSFFPLLMSGQVPLIDVYYRTTPFLSWRQVLIGDPLYNPFKNNPAIKID